MTASLPKTPPENFANGKDRIDEEKRAARDEWAKRLDSALAEASTVQKVPVKRYKTRTNSEWRRVFGSRIPEEAEQKMDYILVYKKKSGSQEPDGLNNEDLAQTAREKFMEALEEEGFDVMKEEIGNLVYLKLHAPFWRLCKEAEREGLKMPVKDVSTHFFCVFA